MGQVISLAEAGAQPAAAEPASLVERSLAGFFWMLIQTMLTRCVQFGAQVVLAWLLTPSDYGVIALAYAVLAFTLLVQQKGIGTVLVARQREFAELASPALWCSLTAGVALMGLLAAAAPGVGAAYNSSQLVGVLLVLACATPFNAVAMIPSTGLVIKLRFRALALVNTMAAIGSAALSILLAALGCGAYSFAVPLLVSAAGVALGLFLVQRPPVHATPEFASWPSLVRPAGLVLLSGVLSRISLQGDSLLLGTAYTTEIVGFYYFAYQISVQTIMLFSNNLTYVLFPSFSRLRDEPFRQRAAFVRSAEVLALVMIPGSFLVAAIADPFIRLLFGGDWVGAIPFLQILALGMGLRALGSHAESYLEAQGRFGACSAALALSCLVFFVLTLSTLRLGPLYFTAAISGSFTVGGAILFFFATGFSWNAARALSSILSLPLLAALPGTALLMYLAQVGPQTPSCYVMAILAAITMFPLATLGLTRTFNPGLWEELMKWKAKVLDRRTHGAPQLSSTSLGDVQGDLGNGPRALALETSPGNERPC